MKHLDYWKIPAPFIKNTTNYTTSADNPDLLMDRIQIY